MPIAKEYKKYSENVRCFIIILLLAVSVFVMIMYFEQRSDTMMAEQVAWEASLTPEQVAHIEQMRTEFEKAKKGTLFVLKNARIGLMVSPVKYDTVVFYPSVGRNIASNKKLNKMFLISVAKIAHPGTREYEILSARFLIQSSQ